jgi:tetratricopeptide (TPR) repeat protein
MLKIFNILILFSVLACGKTKDVAQFNSKENSRYIEMFHEGIRYKQKKQFHNAIHVFEACTELNQFDDAPYFLLSEVYLQTGQRERSIEALQKAIKLDNKNQWYKQELALKYHEIGNYEQAILAYKNLLKSNPENPDWLISLSECYFKSNQMSESYQTMEKLEQVIGSNPEIIIEKYRNLFFQKKYNQGEKILLEGLNMFPDSPDLLAILVDYYFDNKQEKKALDLLKKLSDVDPNNGNAHFTLAQHYIQKNDFPNTYKELKLAFISPDISIDNKTRILMYFYDTQAKLDKNVLELGEILVKQYPNEAKAHTLLGDLLMKDNNEILALASYKTAIELDPSKYSIYEQVLVMEYEFQQYQSLFADGLKAIELFPSYGKIYLLAGTAANQIKKYQEAIDLLLVGKDLITNNPALKAEFLAQLGQAYFKLKKLPEAKKSYDEAIALSPANTLNLNNYAYYLAVEKTDLDKAEKYILQVLEVNPKDYHFLDTYGWVLFQKGDFQKALETFEKAITSNPKEPLINEHLGDCYYKVGKQKEAIDYWKKALELGSKNLNLPKKIEKKSYYDPAF